MSVPLRFPWYGSPQDQAHGKPRGIRTAMLKQSIQAHLKLCVIDEPRKLQSLMRFDVSGLWV